MKIVTWEEAVRWYRSQPDAAPHVRDCYFDLPVLSACERYSESEEFGEILRLLGTGGGRSILDVGAGNGIASYALARHNWRVTALEPDPSDEVGAGAIRDLAQRTQLPITVTENWGEKLPFADSSFDAVHARQVLHHAKDLNAMLREIARVLRPGGQLLTTRDHVADDDAQLTRFLAGHPLHHLYQGENAYPLSCYRQAFLNAGFHTLNEWGPLTSILNYFPRTEAERKEAVYQMARRRWRGVGRLFAWNARFRQAQLRRFTARDQTPGRLYSFLLVKT